MPPYSAPTDSRWGPVEVTRELQRDGERRRARLQRDSAGGWVEFYDGQWIAAPGSRDCSVEEFVGSDAQPVERYGTWFRVARWRTEADRALREWCVRHGELLGTSYAIRARTWHRVKKETVPRPFLPEFDHPDPRLRRAAAAEWRRRLAEEQLQRATAERDAAIRSASQRGASRRQVAKAVGLSFSRIQQIGGGRRT